MSAGGLRAFARAHWAAVEPAAPFVDSWAFGAICEFMQAFHRREFNDGVISVPPGSTKSLGASVLFPAWVWADQPQHKFWTASFDDQVVLRDADRMRNLVQSEDYQLDYPDTRLVRGARGAKSEMWTTAGGLRFSSTVAGKGTGWHFNTVIIDDPVKPQDILGESLVLLQKAQRWRDSTVPTRRAFPAEAFGLMLIMQRLLEGDMAGEELKRNGVAHLCLPMRYVPKAHWIVGDWSAKLDKRTEPDELLNPVLHPLPVVQSLERELGGEASAQLQQNPIPRTGGMLNEEWLRWEWINIPYNGLWIQEWDLSGKGTNVQRHSAVHGALWCAMHCSHVNELLSSIAQRERDGVAPKRPVQVAPAVRWHLVDQVWGVWPFEETLSQMKAAQELPLWNRAFVKRVEPKASGIQALQVLQDQIPGIIDSTVDTPELLSDDKVARFRPLVPPAAQAGIILLPPWYSSGPQDVRGPDAWRKELLAFPRGVRDDRVDTTSSMAAYFRQKAGIWQSNLLELAGTTEQG